VTRMIAGSNPCLVHSCKNESRLEVIARGEDVEAKDVVS
jgi:hypothetical protein